MALSTARTPVIAIVGAGLSGLSLALFLRATISAYVTIFESRSRNAHDDGFLTLAPNALYQLDQLGLYERLLEYGHTFEELQIRSSRGNGTFSMGSVTNGSRKQYGYPALRISRHILRQILLAESDEDPMITIRFNKELAQIFETMDYNGAEESVFMRFADGSIAGYDYVVGADGVHSRVRKVLSEDEATFTGFVSVGGGEVPRSSLPTDQALPCMFLGRTNDILVAPTSSDGSCVSGSTTLEIDTELAGPVPTTTEVIHSIQQRYCMEPDQWPKIVQQLCQHMCDSENEDSLTIWPLFQSPDLYTRITASGRIMLLGDAAHAMVGGQSAAMALEDAASLAKVFGNIFSDARGEATLRLPAALGRWQNQRQKRCKDVESFVTGGEIVENSTGSKSEQILKEWSLWLHLHVHKRDQNSARIYGYREPGPRKVFEDRRLQTW